MRNQQLLRLLMAYCPVFCLGSALGQVNSLKLPPHDIMEQQLREEGTIYTGTRPGDVNYEDGDFDPPPPGQIMLADWKNLQNVNQTIAGYLAAAPNDATGKQSSWYGPLQTWKSSFDEFIESKSQLHFFSLVPTTVAYVCREDVNNTLSPELGKIEYEMRGMGYYIIRAMANHVTEQQAMIGAVNLSNFMKIFAVSGFVEEGAWEDEKIPINAAGVMILDAAAVVTQLKAGPWQQARHFLGGATTASGYFARYAVSGDGLAVLKSKYTANQTVIDAKFSELLVWVDQQEQQAGDEN